MTFRVYELLKRSNADIQLRVQELSDTRMLMRPPASSTLLPESTLSIPVIKHRSLEDHCEPLHCLISMQDHTANTSDQHDIRATMEATINANDDAIIISTYLQIPRDNTAMLGAMRSLYNDRETSTKDESQIQELTKTQNESSINIAEPTPDPLDGLHSKFRSTSLDALQRLSGQDDVSQDWTITPYELDGYGDSSTLIGLGAASSIYKGGWRGYLVAIKELRLMTEAIQSPPRCNSKEARRLFEQEVSFD